MAFSKQEIRLGILVLAWYTCSAMQNIWSKRVLKKLPFPMTLTMAQFIVISVVMPLLMQVWNKRRRNFTRAQYTRGMIPLACLKLFSSLSGFMTLLKVPVSYAHTVKAMMPFFTVSLTRVILGESYSWSIYLSLIPIVGGVLLTTASMVEFNLVGLVAALSSTLSLSIQSIFSKKVMRGIDHLNLLLGTTQLCLAVFTPIWLYHEGFHMMFSGVAFEGLTTMEVSSIFLELMGASACNCAQTIVAFTFLSLVQPVSYSVANVTKRVVVIGASMVTLGEVGNTANLVGMAITLSGVAFYNKVKLDAQKASSRKTSILPTTVSSYERSKYQL